jgi:peptide/nickel transport system substrate-binding protein
MIGPDYFGAAKPEDFPAEDQWNYDPDKAKSLLAQAGQSGLKLSMIISERDDYRQMMVLMQEQLKRVGIDLTLNRVDHAFYHSQIVKHVNPLILFGDITYPNSEIILMRAFRNGALRNFSGLNSATFEGLMDRVAASPHLDERKTLLVQAQQEVAKHSVLIPTIFSGQPLVRLKRVQLGYVLKSSLALEYRYSQLADLTA